MLLDKKHVCFECAWYLGARILWDDVVFITRNMTFMAWKGWDLCSLVCTFGVVLA